MNHQTALKIAGVLIMSFEKRGDISGTFSPEDMASVIEIVTQREERAAYAAGFRAVAEAMRAEILNRMSFYGSTDSTIRRDTEIAQAIRALPIPQPPPEELTPTEWKRATQGEWPTEEPKESQS